jgi:S1-C subfamily serine protease
MGVSRLAVGLAAGGAVTVVLLIVVLLLHHRGKALVSAAAPNTTAAATPPRPGGNFWDNDPIVPEPQRPAPSAPSPSPKDAGHPIGKPLDPVALYAKSRAAVATVSTKGDLGFDAGLGSGFFIARELVGTRYRLYHDQAYLLTNYHVIRSAATAQVRLDDGRSGYVGDVVMEQENADLALVVVSCHVFPRPSSKSKPIATLGIAEGPEPSVGQKVYAIRSPLGLEASLSEGIISGKRERDEGTPWLQFTAPVSPGSSGGPVLDSTGAVIGIAKAVHPDGQNLNVAIPASQIRAFLKGRCNSRPLWRGTGIHEEEEDA